jgi:hypothetical protein
VSPGDGAWHTLLLHLRRRHNGVDLFRRLQMGDEAFRKVINQQFFGQQQGASA